MSGNAGFRKLYAPLMVLWVVGFVFCQASCLGEQFKILDKGLDGGEESVKACHHCKKNDDSQNRSHGTAEAEACCCDLHLIFSSHKPIQILHGSDTASECDSPFWHESVSASWIRSDLNLITGHFPVCCQQSDSQSPPSSPAAWPGLWSHAPPVDSV